MDHMLEELAYPIGTHGGENPTVEQISRKDLYAAWLAGAIDGEGCIFARWGTQTNLKSAAVNDRRLRVSVTIYNTHPVFIRKVTECLLALDVRFNAPACGRNTPRANGQNDRPGIQIVIEGHGRLCKLLPAIIPHLSAKRRQAELALSLVEYREKLAIAGRTSKGRFGTLDLREDTFIAMCIAEIKREKHDFPSVLGYSRKPNELFGESSET
jgi:hypothetical protein